MCGFFGVWNFDKRPLHVSTVVDATNALRNRGPDDEGYYLFNQATGEQWNAAGADTDANLGLFPATQLADKPFDLAMGFRRLSILDLSCAGHQPMSTADRRYWIVYNGELYNHDELRRKLQEDGRSFRSLTDTEVVLQAYAKWGRSCVEHFNGMWAFAIWDSRDHRLFLSRDRFGIKPLYYFYAEGKQLLFASEIKAILIALRRWIEPSLFRIGAYLALGRQPRECEGETFFDEIQAVPPATSVVFERKRVATYKYWQVPLPAEVGATRTQLVDQYRSLLTAAVHRHLRADVPVGSCLSGGVDSTAVVALMWQALQHTWQHNNGGNICQKTFSAVYDKDGPWNERRLIERFLKTINAQCHFVYPTPMRLQTELEDLVWTQEQPFGSLSIFAQWCVMAEAHAKEVKVLLDGQGADEILAGYDPFPSALRCALVAGKWHDAFGIIKSLWRRGYPVGRLLGSELTGALSQVLKSSVGVPLLPRKARLVEMAARAQLKSDVGGVLIKERECLGGLAHSSLHGVLRHWLNHTLVELLRYEDRNSMRWSIEARVPYLDRHVVEFLFGVDHKMWIGKGWSKWIHRCAFDGILPCDIVWRKDKIGFEAPDQWLLSESRKSFEPYLFTDRFKTYVDTAAAVADLTETLRRPAPTKKDLRLAWRWINVAVWLNIMPPRVTAA